MSKFSFCHNVFFIIFAIIYKDFPELCLCFWLLPRIQFWNQLVYIGTKSKFNISNGSLKQAFVTLGRSDIHVRSLINTYTIFHQFIKPLNNLLEEWKHLSFYKKILNDQNHITDHFICGLYQINPIPHTANLQQIISVNKRTIIEKL